MSAALLLLDASSAPLEPASREFVDVWDLALDSCPGDAALPALSHSERAFAARLHAGRGEWVAARAALREILGRYLEIDPAEVPLEAGANGKPRLAAGAKADLRFNLSHSGRRVLIAVRLGHEVGVDVEEVRPGVDGAAIWREVFTEPERAAMAALGSAESAATFFRFWVRREALAKATGLGIVSEAAPADEARFTVRELDGIPGFAAGIASEGVDWSVRRASA